MLYEINGKLKMNIGQALETAVKQTKADKAARHLWEIRKAA